MKFYAHTKDGKTEDEWQCLSDHLKNVSEIASSFGITKEQKEILKITGLLHDLGKYQPEFQRYLKDGGRRGSVPHAAWGARYARSLGMNEISFVIDGHHKGLPDASDWKDDTEAYKRGDVPGYDEVINVFTSDTTINSERLENRKIAFNDPFEREFFIRYLFSALTDADWLDTEEFCDSEKARARNSGILNYDLCISKLDEEIAKKSKEGELNFLRNRVREYAMSKAEMPPAFYSMNLPTGMGKTLTSFSWALHHAKKNNLKRIIIVLPYINIIDQTAKILQDIFGEEWVLEHHSGYNETEKENDDDAKVEEITKRLATENWDYPIIVTTTVQFFESIFNNKRSKCRKIHNIAESVVIFDEVQSLGKEIVLPTLAMLKNISSIMSTSFLFCTATQPAFEKRNNFDGIENIFPLVENCDEIFNKTRRVSYYPVNGYEAVGIDDLFLNIAEENSATLCIFNTKKSALEFFKQEKSSNTWDRIYHLSTSMCPHHRKSVIASIRDDLHGKKKILVSSTQLIEAGVDFDFPCLFREYAPMESIIQSAGRCNREGKLSELGKVFIFKLKDAGMPNKQYRSLSEHTLDMIQASPESLHRHDFFHEYYKSAINLFVDADKRKINEARSALNFETVAGSYRIIEKATDTLFIWQYNKESSALLKQVRSQEYVTREQFRKIQTFAVQVYNHFLIKCEGLYETLPQGLKVWHGKYSKDTGIIDDPPTSDEFVV